MVMNSGYALLFYNWVCSLDNNKLGYIRDKTLIIATDKNAKKHANNAGFKMVYVPDWLITDDLSIGENVYSSMISNINYNYLVGLQVSMIRDLIHMDYNILFQDIDLVWIKDPLKYINILNNKISKNIFDIITSHDHRWDDKGPINSGFMFINSNCKTKSFTDNVMQFIGIPLVQGSDQRLWNKLLNTIPFRDINVHFLDSFLFISGKTLYDIMFNRFGMKFNSRNERINYIKNEAKSYIIHAAWTYDAYHKVERFYKTGHWYFNQNQCSKYFDKSLILDINDRQPRDYEDKKSDIDLVKFGLVTNDTKKFMQKFKFKAWK